MSPVRLRVAAHPSAAALVRVTGRVAKREGCLFDRVLRPAPLQPLASPGAKVDHSIARHGQPRRQARRSPVRLCVAARPPAAALAMRAAAVMIAMSLLLTRKRATSNGA